MQKLILFSKMFMACLIFSIPFSLKGQLTIAGWTMDGQMHYGDTVLSASYSHAAVEVSPLTKNFLTSSSALSNAWGGRNFTAISETGGPYYAAFSITPVDTHSLTFTTLGMNYRRSGTGPSFALLEYSLDNIVYSEVGIFAFPETSNSTASPMTLPTTLANIQQTVHFRLTPYGATSATGTWYIPHISVTDFDLSVEGNVGETTIDDTSTMASCASVEDFGATEISQNTALFTWSYDSAYNHNFYFTYQPSGASQWDTLLLPSSSIVTHYANGIAHYAYTLENLTDSTSYLSKVVVRCDGLNYASDTIFFTTLSPPMPPPEHFLAGWSMLGQEDYGDTVLPASYSHAAVEVSPLTKNFLTSSSALSNAWGGRNFTANSETGGPYCAAFSITPLDTHSLTITAIGMNYRRSGTGPSSALLEYSLDNTEYSEVGIFAFPETSNSTASPITLPTTLANVQQTVYFRLTPYGATSATGTWYIPHISATDFDLYVEGSVGETTIDDTSTIIVCLPVDDLTIETVTQNTASFTWSYDSAYTNPFYLKYKATHEASWNESEVHGSYTLLNTENGRNYFSYIIGNLEDTTTYELFLNVICNDLEHESKKLFFTTLSFPSSVPNQTKESLQLYLGDGSLYLHNRSHLLIDELAVFTLQGEKVLYEKGINRSLHLPFSRTKGLYIVHIIVNRERVVYKVMNL